jgi:hypothetical protein
MCFRSPATGPIGPTWQYLIGKLLPHPEMTDISGLTKAGAYYFVPQVPEIPDSKTPPGTPSKTVPSSSWPGTGVRTRQSTLRSPTRFASCSKVPLTSPYPRRRSTRSRRLLRRDSRRPLRRASTRVAGAAC